MINADTRLELERRVLLAYQEELERSKLPGYVPPDLDADLHDVYEFEPHPLAPSLRLRPTGTSPH